MPSNALCRERLNRILSVLDRQGGSETLRQLERRFGIWRQEIKQAAELGWVKIEIRKPHTGRPANVVIVNNGSSAKLPPQRHEIERGISHRHWLFALKSIQAIKRGRTFVWRFPCFTEAYMKVYKGVRSRRVASASVSRLLRHPDVKAARAWFKAQINGKVPRDESMPDTASAVWQRLSVSHRG
jgi:hypothetical protein